MLPLVWWAPVVTPAALLRDGGTLTAGGLSSAGGGGACRVKLGLPFQRYMDRVGDCKGYDACAAEDKEWHPSEQCTGEFQQCCIDPIPCKSNAGIDGICRHDSLCLWAQSAVAGATGCEAFPSDMRCCVGGIRA